MTHQEITKTFLFFGDSLIDRRSIVTTDPCYNLPKVGETVMVVEHQIGGFYKTLKEMLQLTFPHHGIDFKSFARGGATSADITAQLNACLETHSQLADAAFICIGTNDATQAIFKKGDNISPESFARHYESMLDALQNTSKIIYCILPPPTRTAEESDIINDTMAQYNEALFKFESIYDNVRLIDLYTHFNEIDTAFESAPDKRTLRIDDGIHLSDLGNQLAANIIWDSLILEED